MQKLRQQTSPEHTHSRTAYMRISKCGEHALIEPHDVVVTTELKEQRVAKMHRLNSCKWSPLSYVCARCCALYAMLRYAAEYYCCCSTAGSTFVVFTSTMLAYTTPRCSQRMLLPASVLLSLSLMLLATTVDILLENTSHIPMTAGDYY
eukprot:5784-Heterococcus_DN1.PRE.1